MKGRYIAEFNTVQIANTNSALPDIGTCTESEFIKEFHKYCMGKIVVLTCAAECRDMWSDGQILEGVKDFVIGDKARGNEYPNILVHPSAEAVAKYKESKITRADIEREQRILKAEMIRIVNVHISKDIDQIIDVLDKYTITYKDASK